MDHKSCNSNLASNNVEIFNSNRVYGVLLLSEIADDHQAHFSNLP